MTAEYPIKDEITKDYFNENCFSFNSFSKTTRIKFHANGQGTIHIYPDLHPGFGPILTATQPVSKEIARRFIEILNLSPNEIWEGLNERAFHHLGVYNRQTLEAAIGSKQQTREEQAPVLTLTHRSLGESTYLPEPNLLILANGSFTAIRVPQETGQGHSDIATLPDMIRRALFTPQPKTA